MLKPHPEVVASPRGLTGRGKALVGCPKASFPLPNVGDLNRKFLPKRFQVDGAGAGEEDHKHAVEDCLSGRYSPLATFVLNKKRWFMRAFQGLVQNAVSYNSGCYPR